MSAPKVGERLRCETCGTEIIVVKAPGGAVSCCGATMVGKEQEAKSGQ